MPPLRSSRSGNRSNKNDTIHDELAGIPVAKWRKVPHHYGPKDEPETIEVPWTEINVTMPKGSESYTPYNRALLYALRRGNPPTITVPNPKFNKYSKDKDDLSVGTGFDHWKWEKYPPGEEPPDREFLAKRRPGLKPLYPTDNQNTSATSTMRRAKVRKVDAEGRVSIYEVMVPQGKTVEGEITEDAAFVATTPAPAPGTVVEGVGITNAEGVIVAQDADMQPTPRRRPPPPKRKGKGPGRGRKKVMFAPGLGKETTDDTKTAEEGYGEVTAAGGMATSNQTGNVGVANQQTTGTTVNDPMNIDGEDDAEGGGEDNESGGEEEQKTSAQADASVAKESIVTNDTKEEPTIAPAVHVEEPAAVVAEDSHALAPSAIQESTAAPEPTDMAMKEHVVAVGEPTTIAETPIAPAPSTATEPTAVAVEEPSIAVEEHGVAMEEASVEEHGIAVEKADVEKHGIAVEKVAAEEHGIAMEVKEAAVAPNTAAASTSPLKEEPPVMSQEATTTAADAKKGTEVRFEDGEVDLLGTLEKSLGDGEVGSEDK